MTSRQDILLMFIIWSVSFLVCTVRSVFGAAPVFTNLNSDGSSSIAKGETTASGTSIYTVSASDADGDTLTFTLVSPTTKFTLTMQTIYTSGTFDYEVAADRQYTLTLRVSDGLNNADATLTVNIEDENDETPVISGSLSVTISETDTIGTAVTGLYAVTDADAGDVLHYTLSGTHASYFQIDSGTGAITTAKTLDYEGGTTVFNLLTLSVRDSVGKSATASLTITLTDVNDNAPKFNPSVYYATVNENTVSGTSVTTLTVTDEDSGANAVFTVSVVSGDDPTAKFQLSGTQVQTTSSVINYESLGGQNYKYTLIVQAQDPMLTGTATVYVTINGVNEFNPVWGTFNPSYTGTPSYTISENAGIGTTVVTIAATDDDSGTHGTVIYNIQSVTPNGGGSGTGLFHMDPVNGYLATIGTFDRDTATGGTDYYNVDVRATDGGGRFVDLTIKVSLTNYNDNVPTFAQTVYSLSFSETKTAGSSLMNFIVTDKDETSPTLTFSIESGDISGFFGFDATTKNQLNLNTAINLDSPDNHSPTYSLVIIVKDGGTPELTGTTYVTVSITSENEHSPVFSATSPSSTVQLAEDTAIATSIATVAATDADYGNDGAVTYSISGGNTNNKFQMNPTTGIISLALSLDYETTTSYQLVIHAVDGGTTANTASTTVTISVTDINDNKPTCTTSVISTSISETANVADPVTTLTCSDRDVGYSLSYTITSGNTGSAFSIGAATGAITVNGVLNYDSAIQTYSLVVEVKDGTNTLTVPVAISLTPVNEFTPTFSSSASLTVAENESAGKSLVTYTASDADYDSHDISSYTISAVSNSGSGKFAVNQQTGLIQLATATLDYETLPAGAKYYEVIVVAQDGGGLQGTGTVTVSVTDVNDNAPSCSPASHVVSLPEDTAISSTVIAAFGCSDADSVKTLTYTLTQSPGTSFSLDTSGTPFLKLASTVNYESVQSYELDLVVVDSGSPSKTTTVPIDIVITDINDGGPTFSGSFTASIMENSAIGTSVADVTATDPDSSTSSFGKLKYSILSGDANNQFSINPDTGDVSVRSSLDREMISSYSIVVQAIEEAGTNSATTTLSVTITDVNDNTPTCTQLTFSESFAESASVGYSILTLACSDADTAAYGTLTYSISSGSTTFFQMSSNILQLKNVIDYEGGTIKFDLIITVSDGTRSIQVKGSAVVTDVNEATPVFTNSGSYSSTIAEDTSLGTPITTVTGNDADTANTVTYAFVSTYSLFSLDSSSGQIILVGSLDREMTSLYTLLVTGSDGTNTATATVTVTVTDANDNSPIFNPVAYSGMVSEADAAGASTVATVTATDADDPNTNSNGRINYSILSGGGGVFSIGTSSGAITTTSQLDYETATSYTLIIKAVDKVGAAGAQSATAVVTITVTNINEAAPVFGLTAYSASIPENINVGTSVIQVMATDMDSGTDGMVHYSMATNANFYLDSDTGIIYVKSALDYESSTLYSLTIEAIDKGTPARTGTSTVSISLTDVNDHSPVFHSGGVPTSSYTIYLDENVSVGHTVTSSVVASDADSGVNGNVMYMIVSGDGASVFLIDVSSGVITTNAAIDYETKTLYSIIVQAADDGTPSKSTMCSVLIHINDLNDNAPVFQTANYAVAISETSVVGTSVTKVTATDADSSANNNNVVRYSLTLTTYFSINPTTGIINTAAVLDRETIDSHTLTVLAVDQGTNPSSKTGTTTVTVLLNDVNDNNPIISGTYDTSVTEDTTINTVVFHITATDADKAENALLTYTITAGDTNSDFKIDPSLGIVQIQNALDRETTNTYYLVVTITDNGATPRSATTTATITILDINDNNPIFTATSFTFSVSENVPIATSVARLTVTDHDINLNGAITISIPIFWKGTASHFTIHPTTGVISTAGSLNRETLDEYQLLVRSVDGGTPMLSSEVNVTITISDYNDNSPVFGNTIYTGSSVENQPVDTSILTVVVTDADIGINAAITLTIDTSTPNGVTASQYLKVNSMTSVISVKQVIDRETVSSFSFNLIATDGGTSTMSATTFVRITILDVNDNNPVFSSTFYNTEIAYNDGCQFTITMVTATDADEGANAEVSYYFTQNNYPTLFSLDGNTGHIKLFATATSDTIYKVDVGAKDNGSPQHTTSTAATVRIDTYSPNSVIIAFYLSVSKTSYTSMETSFLSQLTAVYRLTYSTSEAKCWCVTELSSSSCKVLVYVIKDDSASTISDLNVAKPFLTSDEAYNIAAKDTVDTPANDIVGPGWYNFNITKVEKYYVVQSASSEKPWIQTTIGIAVVSTCSFVALVALIGITIAIVRYLRKKKGVNPNEKERAGLSEDGDRVSNSKFKSNGKDSEVKPFDKSHPPPAVVALPFPNMRQPMTFENEVPLNNYPQRKSGSQAREKSKNRDPEKSLEEESRDGYFKQTSSEEPYRQPPSYWNTYSRQPLTAPMLPQQAPSTQVSSRQDIPGTPLPQEKQKYAVINRKFDGRAIDSVTGRLYEYNTKTNERQWVTTLDGKEVKLASESS